MAFHNFTLLYWIEKTNRRALSWFVHPLFHLVSAMSSNVQFGNLRYFDLFVFISLVKVKVIW
jgi:hypothetical protein